MGHRIENPTAGRKIIIDSALYQKLIRDGYSFIDDPDNKALKLTQKDMSILDTDIPDIEVVPLKPTPLCKFKNKIVKNSSSIADWLWKFTENKKKNANEIADWILTQTDKVAKKVLPTKIQELIELSQRTPYNGSKKMYWKINEPSNNDNEGLILDKLKKERLTHEEEHYSKYLKMYYYNHITSLDDVRNNLMKTYKDENNAFKLLFSFGYVTEKKNDNDDDYEIKLYEASQDYFDDKPRAIKNKCDMTNLLSEINGEKIIHKLIKKFPDTKTRMIGVYSMAVKVIRLDFLIGAKIQLPDYIKKSNHIIGLEDVGNNLCFWACLALAEGCTKNRFVKRTKELFNKYYKTNMKKFDDYKGFDYVNELDKYEAFNVKYAINIVRYYQDGSIEYVKRSEFNAGGLTEGDEPTRTSIYFNLYSEHFSYIPNLEKLAKMYICNRCSSKFDNNFNLTRHIEECKLEQEDKFAKYPQIYERKRNDIVQLCDWFNVEDVDYKYDYLIAFELEAMLKKIYEIREGIKLNFT